MGRLHAIGAGTVEGAHVRLRHTVPDHLAPITISAPAPRWTRCIVLGAQLLPLLKHSGSQTEPVLRVLAQQFSCMPIGSRHDRFAGAQGISQGSRYGLRLVTVGRKVNIGRANQRAISCGLTKRLWKITSRSIPSSLARPAADSGIDRLRGPLCAGGWRPRLRRQCCGAGTRCAAKLESRSRTPCWETTGQR